MKQGMKGVVEMLFNPIVGYFGPRFDNVHSRLDQIGHHAADLDTRMTEVQNQVEAMVRRLDDFERHISTDIQTSVEVLLTHQRSTAILQERIAELQHLVERLHPAEGRAAQDDPQPSGSAEEKPIKFSRASS